MEINKEKIPKITVIMPVYNSEEFLYLAVESVLRQTMEDWELLLINDGSKDNSGEICEQYAKKDARIKVFHQQNKGITKTRNRGILEARGEYLTFIDNDDEYLPDMLEKTYEIAKKYKAQIVKFGYRVEEDFKNGIKETRDNCAKKVIIINQDNLGDVYPEVKNSGYFNMIWNGIYEKKLFEDTTFLFDESIIMGYEDWIFNNKIFLHPKVQVIMDYIGYIHYQRYQHSTSKKFHPNQIMASVKAAETECELIHKINKSYGTDFEWINRAADYLIDIIFLFERKGCDYSYKKEKIELQKIREQKVFSIFFKKECVDVLPRQRRMMVQLLKNRKYLLLVYLSKVYYKFIMWKKARNR